MLVIIIQNTVYYVQIHKQLQKQNNKRIIKYIFNTVSYTLYYITSLLYI